MPIYRAEREKIDPIIKEYVKSKKKEATKNIKRYTIIVSGTKEFVEVETEKKVDTLADFRVDKEEG